MTAVSDSIGVGEAAKRLGVSTREVLRLIDHGKLPVHRDGRRQLAVPVELVEAMRATK